MSDQIVADPVCGKQVDKLRARAVGIFGGVTYYFCSAECKTQFKDPRKAPRESPREPAARPAERSGEPPTVTPSKAAPVVTMTAEPEAPEPVAYAHSRPRRSDPEPALKVDPSPSVEAEVAAIKGGGKAWLVVVLLFAAAGVVLYFALHK